ncbi:MAG TPA: transglycosylase family protein, partial [Nitriliruptoraceae bacterium]|nr:transglycosylase family protein [Nitriliruptoraceae bacterium]
AAAEEAAAQAAAEEAAAQAAAEEAAAQAAAEEAAAAEQAPAQEASTGSHWDRLADCESGDWGANGVPISGSARWNYGINFSHGDIYEGGLNFHPGTWDSYRSGDMPGHAGQASRSQQIAVAEQVLADQGWGAWPVCSSKIGLR